MDERDTLVFRPTTSIVLSVSGWALIGLGGATAVGYAIALGEPHRLWALVPVALLALLVWELFWRPRVVVTDADVTLVNPFHTVTVAWSSLIDVDTRFALTLVTPQRRYRAAAAPAPGPLTRPITGAASAHPAIGPADRDGGRRASSALGTDSGDLAAIVRDRWMRLAEAERIPLGQADAQRARVRIHLASLATVVALLTASLPAIALA